MKITKSQLNQIVKEELENAIEEVTSDSPLRQVAPYVAAGVGTSLGALLGLIGGPPGVALGAMGGGALGKWAGGKWAKASEKKLLGKLTGALATEQSLMLALARRSAWAAGAGDAAEDSDSASQWLDRKLSTTQLSNKEINSLRWDEEKLRAASKLNNIETEEVIRVLKKRGLLKSARTAALGRFADAPLKTAAGYVKGLGDREKWLSEDNKMKIDKSQLKQIIKEETKNALKESPYGSFGPPWGPDDPNYEFEDDEDVDPTEKYDDPVYQLNDELVTAAMRAIMEVVSEKVEVNFPPKEAKEFVEFAELDFEESLMDLLLPLAERLMSAHKALARRMRG